MSWVYHFCPGAKPTIKPPPMEQQWNDRGFLTWNPPRCTYRWIESGEEITTAANNTTLALDWLHTESATARRQTSRQLECIEHKTHPELFMRPRTANERWHNLFANFYRREHLNFDHLPPDLAEQFRPFRATWSAFDYWTWIGPENDLHSLWRHS